MGKQGVKIEIMDNGADGNAALFRKPSACFAVSPEPFLDSEFFRVIAHPVCRFQISGYLLR